jgi:formylglycine-generating enzyme required for sulfatase activity
VAAIDEFADPEQGLVRGLSPRHGWGVARRLDFARTLEERSLGGAAARAAWDAARASIRDADECPAYAGLELAPQLGLLPLGRDPESGLHEFADLATGEPPRRGADGRLELAAGASVVFVLLPGGTTLIGAQAGDPSGLHHDPDATEAEKPPHRVTLAPFFLSKYELTQGQWQRFTGRRPSKHLAGTRMVGRALSELSPLEQVSWSEARRELARLGWALPTEAQWEYAARAGTDWPWWTGFEPESLQGAANLSDRFANSHGATWASSSEVDDGYMVEAPVGSFAANPFGLHDVHGNVYEWCRDSYGSYALAVAPRDGERLGGIDTTRVVRGGGYSSAARGVRSAKRDNAPPELTNESIGLRPMRALGQ